MDWRYAAHLQLMSNVPVPKVCGEQPGQFPKLIVRVRFPSPAPRFGWSAARRCPGQANETERLTVIFFWTVVTWRPLLPAR